MALRKLRSEQLKQSRIAANICQVDLSLESGISRDTIRNIEKSISDWKVDTELIYMASIESIVKRKESSKKNKLLSTVKS